MNRKEKKKEKIPEWAASLYRKISILSYKVYVDIAREICQEFISDEENLKILDVGTGHGFLPLEIIKLRPKVIIYAFDLNKKLIKYAAKYTNQQKINQIYFCIADANFLPFQKDCFDVVISTGVLHELRNPIKVLNECYRVLKSNGVTIVYDPIPLRSEVKLWELSPLNSIKYLIYKLYKKIFPCPSKYLPFEKIKDTVTKSSFESWQIEKNEEQKYFKIILKKGKS